MDLVEGFHSKRGIYQLSLIARSYQWRGQRIAVARCGIMRDFLPILISGVRALFGIVYELRL